MYYNAAAVLDADGKYLGKMRKVHIPHTYPAFWEKFYFKPGTLGFPVFQTAYAKIGIFICYDRHFPECARILALKGAEILFNPSATTEGKSRYLWELEQPVAGRGQRGVHRGQQPRRPGEALGVRQVLRLQLLRGPARQDPREGQRGQGRGGRRRTWTWTRSARCATAGSSSGTGARSCTRRSASSFRNRQKESRRPVREPALLVFQTYVGGFAYE